VILRSHLVTSRACFAVDCSARVEHGETRSDRATCFAPCRQPEVNKSGANSTNSKIALKRNRCLDNFEMEILLSRNDVRFAVKTMFGLKIVSKAKTMSVSTRVRPEHRFKHRNFALQSTAHSKLSALGILDLAETPNPCPNTTHIRVRVRPNPPNTPKMCDAPLSLNKMNSMIRPLPASSSEASRGLQCCCILRNPGSAR
jgi:hypothetical protein